MTGPRPPRRSPPRRRRRPALRIQSLIAARFASLSGRAVVLQRSALEGALERRQRRAEGLQSVRVGARDALLVAGDDILRGRRRLSFRPQQRVGPADVVDAHHQHHNVDARAAQHVAVEPAPAWWRPRRTARRPRSRRRGDLGKVGAHRDEAEIVDREIDRVLRSCYTEYAWTHPLAHEVSARGQVVKRLFLNHIWLRVCLLVTYSPCAERGRSRQTRLFGFPKSRGQ